MIGVDVKVKGDVDAIKRDLISLNPSERIRLYVLNTMHVDPRNPDKPPIPMKELVLRLIYGDAETPARPFFDDFVRDQNHEITSILMEAVRIKGKSGLQRKDRFYIDYEGASVKVLALLRNWLMSGEYYRTVAPNSDYTVALKGHDTPLVDTGQLIAALDVKTVYRPKKEVTL